MDDPILRIFQDTSKKTIWENKIETAAAVVYAASPEIYQNKTPT